jgi:cytochrome c peroxidase
MEVAMKKHLTKYALTRQPIFSWILFLVTIVMPLIVFTADGRGDDAQGYGEYLKQYTRPKSIAYPADNDYSAEREMLGKTLFFDPRLSGSNWISCATCHNPGLSWGDGLPKAIGHGMQVLGRRTPTILNLAWSPALFWDGRAASLEEQALGPIAAPGEMNMPLEQMVGKIRALPGYRSMFDKAYPNETLDEKTIAKAIANFERTVVSGKAPFDRWVEGDERAVSTEAKRGFALFNGKANCAKCHSGWRFTDDSFHDIGIPGSDPGRGKLFQTVAATQYSFKTPSLRNVERRAPYMHDGSEGSLEEVVELYAAGGRMKRPSLSPEIKPLNLTAQDKLDLVAFLQTLTSADRSIESPSLPR